MWVRAEVKVVLFLSCTLLLLGNLACSDEPGRIRASSSALVGAYEIKLDNGVEHLELRRDGTYTQDVPSKSRPLRHSGQWHIENHFLDGSDVVLTNAAVTEADEKSPPQFGEMFLNVHDRSGKMALARNEAADWYYDRIP